MPFLQHTELLGEKVRCGLEPCPQRGFGPRGVVGADLPPSQLLPTVMSVLQYAYILRVVVDVSELHQNRTSPVRNGGLYKPFATLAPRQVDAVGTGFNGFMRLGRGKDSLE